MAKMENDNLTQLLSKWKDMDDAKPADLSAISLYREFIAESSVEGSEMEAYSETATEFIQMVQGINVIIIVKEIEFMQIIILINFRKI